LWVANVLKEERMKKEMLVIGYGNQGSVWAKNLRDSGWQVKVSGRSSADGGKGIQQAARDGFKTVEPTELYLCEDQNIAILLPDEQTEDFAEKYLNTQKRKKKNTFYFAHAFAITFKKFSYLAEDDIVLVAPKGWGAKLRENFKKGGGLFGVLAVEEDKSQKAWSKAMAVAEGLGLCRVGTVNATFDQETHADLLSEQAVLCGPVPFLVDKCFRFLLSKGIPAEMALQECVRELQIVVDLINERGLEQTLKGASLAARYGGLKAATFLINEKELNNNLEQLWQNITDGSFAKDLDQEKEKGYPELTQWFERYQEHPVDQQL